jgi:hypothetical protein
VDAALATTGAASAPPRDIAADIWKLRDAGGAGGAVRVRVAARWQACQLADLRGKVVLVAFWAR